MDGSQRIEPARQEAFLEAALERLSVEARAPGVSVEEVRRRLSRELDAFREQRRTLRAAPSTPSHEGNER